MDPFDKRILSRVGDLSLVRGTGESEFKFADREKVKFDGNFSAWWSEIEFPLIENKLYNRPNRVLIALMDLSRVGAFSSETTLVSKDQSLIYWGDTLSLPRHTLGLLRSLRTFPDLIQHCDQSSRKTRWTMSWASSRRRSASSCFVLG